MIQHKHANIFMRPVDPVALNIPDYFDIVKNPMDLMTVHKRISSGLYDSPSLFEGDMLLIWKNAMLYNPVGNFVHNAAKNMMKDFTEQYRNVEDQLRIEEERHQLALASSYSKKKRRKPVKMHVFVSSSSRKSVHGRLEDDTDKKAELARLRREFAELQQKAARLQKLEERRKSHGKKKPAVRQIAPKKLALHLPETKKHPLKLTSKQKASLSRGIQSLEHEELMELIAMVAPGSCGKEEVELDLDDLTPQTYRMMQSFIRRHGKNNQFKTPEELGTTSPRPIGSVSESNAEDDSESESDSDSD